MSDDVFCSVSATHHEHDCPACPSLLLSLALTAIGSNTKQCNYDEVFSKPIALRDAVGLSGVSPSSITKSCPANNCWIAPTSVGTRALHGSKQH